MNSYDMITYLFSNNAESGAIAVALCRDNLGAVWQCLRKVLGAVQLCFPVL